MKRIGRLFTLLLCNSFFTCTGFLTTNRPAKSINFWLFRYVYLMMKLILIIMKLYENELGSALKYDFDDLIKKATDVIVLQN